MIHFIWLTAKNKMSNSEWFWQEFTGGNQTDCISGCGWRSTVQSEPWREGERFVFISKFCVFADRHWWWGHSGRQTFIWRGFQGFPYDRFKHFTQIFLPYILNKSTNTQLIKDTEYRKTKITLPPPNKADLPCLKPSNGHMAEQFTSQSWPSVCKHSCPWAWAADGLFSSVTEKSHTVFSFRKQV